MINTILNRKSVRRYTDQTISETDLHTILDAAMSGPTAVNARPWSFIVVQDKDMLNKMADVNGRAAEPLRNAACGILVCGDLERAFPKAPDYWVIDASIAVQNMILAAETLGLGSVWLGTWPQEEKIKGQAELFNLPSTIVPHSILSIGYPNDEVSKNKVKKNFEEDRVHYEKW